MTVKKIVPESADMQILRHHIYEYHKGLRMLVLHTMKAEELSVAEKALEKNNISYYVQQVTNRKINIFFGAMECIEIIKSFNKDTLSHLSEEEDFILGIMLGYDREKQCKRFLERKNRFFVSKNIVM
jgi:hypothetical protein